MKAHKFFNFSIFVILITISFMSYTQDVNGTRGGNVNPVSVSIQQMQLITQPSNTPVQEKEEGIPPYAPAIEPPLASTLTNVTYDNVKKNINPLMQPTLGTGFEGITQNGYIPSEPSAAAGPLNIFSPGNVSVTITNKDGSNRVQIDGDVFFGAPTSEGEVSDPVCCYDAIRGRFVALAFTQGSSGSNKWANYYLMISQTNDARGSWWRYKFNWKVDGSTTTNNWGDFEEFGFSGDKFAISSQQFSFRGNSYQYQKLRVMDITKLYAGQPVTWIDFVKFAAPPGGDISSLFVTKPGRNLTSGDNTIYLLTTRYNGGSTVAYRTITGTPTSPSLSGGTLVSVNTYGASVNAQGGSSSATVNCGDCRTTNFVVRNGFLHIAWHFGINFGNGNVDAVRYLKLDVTNIGSPVKVTDETFGANGIFYYYPSCTVDNYGNMFIGFGRSSLTEYPSSWISGKRTTDATIEASAIAKQGAAVTSQSRWGDFTGIDMDETASSSTQSVAWYGGQWTKASNNFGTWVSQLTFTTPTSSVTKVSEEQNYKPKEFRISQNYPNPFNPSSVINYQIPFDAKVTIKIYSILGTEVATLANEYEQAGSYTSRFDGSNVSSGIYFYKITAEGNGQVFERTIKMILTK